jgi:hypothetical protein
LIDANIVGVIEIAKGDDFLGTNSIQFIHALGLSLDPVPASEALGVPVVVETLYDPAAARRHILTVFVDRISTGPGEFGIRRKGHDHAGEHG